MAVAATVSTGFVLVRHVRVLDTTGAGLRREGWISRTWLALDPMAGTSLGNVFGFKDRIVTSIYHGARPILPPTADQRPSTGILVKLLIVGSTGLVGRHALALALAHPHIEAVIAPARRAASIEHPKLLAPVVDFDALPTDAPWWQVDAVVCALGTTIRVAGSEAAFRRVDHDYPLAVARIARAHGVATYVLNSAMGADVESRIFYSRVKGELERDLASVYFTSLTLVRPGLIGGERDEFRAGERAATVVLRALHPLLPRRWRINPAQRIAQCMIDAAVAAAPGTHVIGSDELI